MTPVRPFWQTESHALIVRDITLPRAQILTALLLSRERRFPLVAVPIRLQRPFGPTLAH